MQAIYIALAVEDDLSEALAETLLKQSERPFCITRRLGKSGFGYLKARIHSYNQAASNGLPFLIITDLDASTCAPALINEWLKGSSKHHNLMLRVAKREIEAWVMAHREALAKYLSIPLATVPHDPEAITDPKATLLKLAKKARRTVQQELIPARGSTATQGPGYNVYLSRFIRNHWNAKEAAQRSDSLRRAWKEVLAFNPI